MAAGTMAGGSAPATAVLNGAPPAAPPKRPNAGPLGPGMAFGGRYHVIRLLGAGGMGAVYQAWDNELGVAVALKVIRPEMVEDPDAARDLERRFKRELLLARQVTHKNVVRIHDLGEIDGIKYITMPYIQGTDLSTCLHKEGKLSPAKVMAIARQVAQGLAAAHESGVVHRDLKPANIMIDEDDRAVIMDFGIARSTSGGMTALGTVVGTLEYMAPEQAMGQPVDHRADIYTFGLILYDLLLGRRASTRAESAVAELMKRMQQALPPARAVDPNVPEGLAAVIARCMEPDAALRYQTTVELVAAIENLDPHGEVIDPAKREAPGHRSSSFPLHVPAAAAPAPAASVFTPARLAAAALVVVALGGGIAYFAMRSGGGSGTASDATGVNGRHAMAVLPFRNRTGDPTLDWLGGAAAEMLKGAVPEEQIRTVSSDRVFQVLRDLRIPADRDPDAGMVKRLAEFSNATAIVSGEFVKADGQIRLSANVRDMRTGASHVLTAAIVDQKQILEAVSTIGRGIQERLLAGTAAATARGAPLRPSTESVEALQAYSEGVELGRRGNHLEAVKKFEAAVGADSGFALAYSRLAQSYATIGHDSEAERASRRAVENAGSLPEREKLAVDAVHARILNDQPRAIAAYERLLNLAPGDSEVQFHLAGRYEATGQFDQALEAYKQVLESDPRYFDALFAAGRVEVLRKNPQGSLDYFSRALNVAIAVDNDEARAYALNATGVAYKRLNKPEDAHRYYAEALDIRKRLGDKRGMASTLSELAQVQETQGKLPEALTSYRSSLALLRDIGDKRGVGNVLINLGSLHQAMGQYDDALTQYKEALQLQTEVGNADYQALALQNIGTTLFAQAQYEDAASYLNRALLIREKLNVPVATAEALQSLGDVALRQGQFDQALERYLKALELCRSEAARRCVALVSLGMGMLFDEQGRYRAALDAKKEAVDILREIGDTTPMLAEALAGQGRTFALLGQPDEARTALEEATKEAQRLADARLIAEALAFRGEAALLAGRRDEAVTLLTQGSQKASASGDRYLPLWSKLKLADATLSAGRTQPASTLATGVATDAGRLGLRALAAEAAMIAGEALAAQKAYERGRTALEDGLRDAERIGARPLLLRAHHSLAMLLRSSGKGAEAGNHTREAGRILDELEKEAGADLVQRRPDLRAIADALRAASASSE